MTKIVNESTYNRRSDAVAADAAGRAKAHKHANDAAFASSEGNAGLEQGNRARNVVQRGGK